MTQAVLDAGLQKMAVNLDAERQGHLIAYRDLLHKWNRTVTLKDTYGNTATGYRGTVHFTSTDDQAALPANYTFIAGDAGTHSFSVTFKTTGSQSVTVADTTTNSLKASATLRVGRRK